MAEHVAIRLRKGKKLTGGLSLWVRRSYQSSAPSIKVSCKIDPTQSSLVIQNEALRMFSSKYQGGPVREIGIGGFNLSDENIKQLTLFDTMLDDRTVRKQETLQQAVDEIREKFDFTAIQKASALAPGSRVLERHKMIGGHAAAGGENL